MKIPKIDFRYSWVYDGIYRNSDAINESLKSEGKKYPSINEIIKFRNSAEKYWQAESKTIMTNLSKITRLDWKEDKIKCYFVGWRKSFSDPLTIGIINLKNKDDFIDTLTHELIHQIQIQSDRNMKKWFDYLSKRYELETKSTRNHIFLHAVHWKLLISLYGKKRLDKNIIKHEKYSDYKRAWEIVKKEGYENIIKEFTKRTE